MKRTYCCSLCILFLLIVLQPLRAQTPLSFLDPDSLKKDLAFLASDSLKGRGNFTKDLDKAAVYISKAFKNAGLKFFDGYTSYFQPFIVANKQIKQQELVTINDSVLSSNTYFFLSAFEYPASVTSSGFAFFECFPNSIQTLKDSLLALYGSVSKPILVRIPQKDAALIDALKTWKSDSLPQHSILVIAADDFPEKVSVNIHPVLRKQLLNNVIGVLPGFTHADEIVMITAHYDHVGITPNLTDSINNGANDNASGTAALLAFAKYFAANSTNNRTIVFVAFAGEELGLVGSKYLTKFISPEKVVALFNFEMIGQVNVLGKKTVYITGGNQSNLGSIVRKESGKLKIINDDNDKERLFSRSDNFPFAILGIPAHTFMCFTPSDIFYHTPSDEIKNIDFNNMSFIVKGLLPGIEGIVQAKATPSRLK